MTREDRRIYAFREKSLFPGSVSTTFVPLIVREVIVSNTVSDSSFSLSRANDIMDNTSFHRN